MNKLKSVFLTLYVTFCVINTIIGVYMTLTGVDSTIWLPVTMSVFLPVFFFAKLYLVKTPRTTPGLMGFSVGIFICMLYALYISYSLGVASPVPLIGLLSLVGWSTYVGWYSSMDRSKSKLKVGKKLPKLDLEDYSGNRVTSQDWNQGASLIMFYRGNWCPICTAQIQELMEYEDRFEEMGMKMKFVSPQSHKKSENFAKRTGMKADFLVDKDNLMAKKLGILQEGGLPFGFQALGYDSDVPMPTMIIVDASGKIKFLDLTDNYRLRPTPGDLITALES